ncbi:MAG: hypothetical protein IPM68_03105 [Flavobacteriales bacterium]|nr:hypothetical protein [Flavobacteriales bacterium]
MDRVTPKLAVYWPYGRHPTTPKPMKLPTWPMPCLFAGPLLAQYPW